MAQALRNTGANVPAYWHTMRDRIKGQLAVDIANKILAGGDAAKEITPQQERVALFLINKLMPNLQAVAVQIQTDRPQTRDDINALLTTTGIKPDQVWAALTGNRERTAIEGQAQVVSGPSDASAENSDPVQDDPEGAPTPGDGA